MPGSPGSASSISGAGYTVPLGTVYPGGTFQIVSGTQASPTELTTLAPHGLTTGDTIFFTSSTTANAALTAVPQQVVTVTSTTKFTVPVNCSVAGATAGAYDIAVLSIPVTGVGVAATVNTGSAHGLRVGDTVTLVATGAVSTVGTIDGLNTVTAVPTSTSFVIGACTNVTTPASATAGHYTKTTFNSDVWDSKGMAYQVGIVLTSVIGTAPVTTKVDIQGSLDYDPIKQAAGTVNGTWFNVPYAIITAPQTLAVAQLTVTTATSTNYKMAAPGEPNYFPYRYLRLQFSSSTNIVMSANLLALPKG